MLIKVLNSYTLYQLHTVFNLSWSIYCLLLHCSNLGFWIWTICMLPLFPLSQMKEIFTEEELATHTDTLCVVVFFSVDRSNSMLKLFQVSIQLLLGIINQDYFANAVCSRSKRYLPM